MSDVDKVLLYYRSVTGKNIKHIPSLFIFYILYMSLFPRKWRKHIHSWRGFSVYPLHLSTFCLHLSGLSASLGTGTECSLWALVVAIRRSLCLAESHMLIICHAVSCLLSKFKCLQRRQKDKSAKTSNLLLIFNLHMLVSTFVSSYLSFSLFCFGYLRQHLEIQPSMAWNFKFNSLSLQNEFHVSCHSLYMAKLVSEVQLEKWNSYGMKNRI
jgi:hypothetical protein